MILDLTMPRLDGVEVVQALRQMGSAVPVLVMSGYSALDVAARLKGIPAGRVLQKPFRPRDLRIQLSALRVGAGAADAVA